MSIKEIKELAKKFTKEQLENCILQTVSGEKNDCSNCKGTDGARNE